MASAPRPGVGRRIEEEEGAQQVLTITVKRELTTGGNKPRPIQESNTLAIGSIPIREQIICRKATGLPFAAYWSGEDAIGLDSLVVLWWLARRANGEVNLTFDDATKQWPADLDVENELDVDFDDPSEDAADPEASGPV